jgi:hypothetical protein
VEAMKLHQRPHLIYNADATGLKPTNISGNQTLLAVKGNKSSRRKRRNRDNSGLHECKWKQFDSPNGSVKGKVHKGLSLNICIATTFIS